MELTKDELQLLAGILGAKMYEEFQTISMAVPSLENDRRQDRFNKLCALHSRIVIEARKPT